MRPQSVPRVLVVEDDAVVRRAIRLACEKDGLRVSEAVSGPQALESLARERPDLVLLDLLLPGLSGLDVCRAIRRVDDTLPVIMVTAKGEETDKVVGLELGADDYIAKPFGPRELVARVRAVLRRQAALRRHLLHAGEAEAPLRFGELAIWPEGRQVRLAGRPVHLTRTEFELLAALASHAGRVLTRDQLVAQVWGYDGEGPSRLLDSHIQHLRRKLGPPAAGLLHTVRHVGYRLNRHPC